MFNFSGADFEEKLNRFRDLHDKEGVTLSFHSLPNYQWKSLDINR